MELIDKYALLQNRDHAKRYDGEMYVVGQGYIMSAPIVDPVHAAGGSYCRECVQFLPKGTHCDIKVEWADGECWLDVQEGLGEQKCARKGSDFCSRGKIKSK